jgi:hypothetical protein
VIVSSHVSRHMWGQWTSFDLCTSEAPRQEEGILVEGTFFSIGKGFCFALKALTLPSEGEES